MAGALKPGSASFVPRGRCCKITFKCYSAKGSGAHRQHRLSAVQQTRPAAGSLRLRCGICCPTPGLHGPKPGMIRMPLTARALLRLAHESCGFLQPLATH